MTVDQVVQAAIGIADEQGLGQLTIRTVAAALGAAPMAIYTYVPGKAELLDPTLDAVYQQMPRTELTGMSWRDKVSAIATRTGRCWPATDGSSVCPPHGHRSARG